MLLNTLLFALFAGIFGLLLCFGGYRFFTVMLPVWAFFGGLWLGAKGVFILLGGGFLGTATGLTVGVVLGVLMAIFAWQFYVFGLALVGAVIGAWLGAGIMTYLGFERGTVTALVTLVCAIALGFLTYLRNWQDEIITGLSAIGGANCLVLSVLLLLGRVSMMGLKGAGSAISPILRDSPAWLLLWLGLTIAGIIVQRRNYREVTFTSAEFYKYWS